MATGWTLALYAETDARAAAASQDAFDEIDRLEDLLSNYRASSELERINRDAGQQAVTTDPETMRFLLAAQHWSAVSDGAFDITVGALMKGWGFYRHAGTVPSPQQVGALLSVTGWRRLQLDPADRSVRFTTPGVQLDPGGIGKGFAVDAAIAVLRAEGVRAALLSAGTSTIYGLGAPPGQDGWKVSVPGPLPSESTLSRITLRDNSLSSADCVQKHFIAGGHLYCHIMDPRTGLPVEGRVQVSIADPSATASDALSNALFVQSPAQSLRMLQHFAPEAHALIVSRTPNGSPRCTAFRWKATVHCAAPPTKVALQ